MQQEVRYYQESYCKLRKTVKAQLLINQEREEIMKLCTDGRIQLHESLYPDQWIVTVNKKNTQMSQMSQMSQMYLIITFTDEYPMVQPHILCYGYETFKYDRIDRSKQVFFQYVNEETNKLDLSMLYVPEAYRIPNMLAVLQAIAKLERKPILDQFLYHPHPMNIPKRENKLDQYDEEQLLLAIQVSKVEYERKVVVRDTVENQDDEQSQQQQLIYEYIQQEKQVIEVDEIIDDPQSVVVDKDRKGKQHESGLLGFLSEVLADDGEVVYSEVIKAEIDEEPAIHEHKKPSELLGFLSNLFDDEGDEVHQQDPQDQEFEIIDL